jgi:YT521-B-like domain
LDLSVQKNFWATQRHNEEILDQAYRTSKDVFLIFSVNKSGEFYGYARFVPLSVLPSFTDLMSL